MALFDHTVEYSSELFEDELGGPAIKLRKAVVRYTDLLGEPQTYTLMAPEDVWTEVKVGGTMSTGAPPEMGVVTDVLGERYRVWVQNVGEIMCTAALPNDSFVPGDNGMVFDYMVHGHQEYGEFIKVVTKKFALSSQLGLHSINLIILKDNDQQGVIHLDPFTSQPSYVHIDPLIGDGWFVR